jgi:predicted phosphate transport protein (TIGR00153 family)
MKDLGAIFGESPFELVTALARKIHECVALVRPIADAILVGDMERLRSLQDTISRFEEESDVIKDHARQNLPRRMFLSSQREDILAVVRQLDRIGDKAQNFAVAASFRPLSLPPDVAAAFLDLVDKVVQLSECLLSLAEHAAALQKEGFAGRDTDETLARIESVYRMEWESDRLNRQVARLYYSAPGIDPIAVILMDKLCMSLGQIADHAENAGKSLRLMIVRK